MKAFVVPPAFTSAGAWARALARRTRAAHPQPPPPARRPGGDGHALHMARSDRQLRRPVSGAALSLYAQLKTSNIFLENVGRLLLMANWSFLTSHARVLLCIARDPGMRLRDIARQPGHHRAQRPRHRRRPCRARLRDQAERRPPQPLPVSGRTCHCRRLPCQEPASQIWAEPAPVYARGTPVLIVDMSAATFCGLAGGSGARAAAGPCHRGELRLIIAAAQVRRVFELAGADRIVRLCPDDFSASQGPESARPGRRRWPAGPGRGWSAAPGPPARLKYWNYIASFLIPA